MMKKEKQRKEAFVAADVDSDTTSSAQSTSTESTPIGDRKWTVGQQSLVADRQERTKNVICKSVF